MTIVRWVSGVGLLTIAAVVGAASPAGQSAQPVPFPDGYRSWQVIKSMIVGPEHRTFARRGGMHHYYANPKAIEGYRIGRFPNGSVIVVEALSTKDGEGDAKGLVLEGNRRFLEVMVKDDRLYGETSGWGFERYEGEDTSGRLTMTERSQCHQCHAKRKDRDLVFTSPRP
jgi:Cytochrome P460